MSSLTTTGPDLRASDIFFGQAPHQSNWAEILTSVAAGGCTSASCIKALTELEPVPIASPDTHTIFVLQQTLRLCLRKEAGKPLLSDVTCSACGTNKVDDVLEYCLACAEERSQYGSHGNRGNCIYLRPYFDPSSRTWGVLFYQSHFRTHDDNIYQFWVALGWPNRRAVEMALYPLSLFETWMSRKLDGLGDYEPDDFFTMNGLMTLQLPMTPAVFEQVMREQMAEEMTDPDVSNGYSYRIARALEDYDYKHRKQK